MIFFRLLPALNAQPVRTRKEKARENELASPAIFDHFKWTELVAGWKNEAEQLDRPKEFFA